jgi:hypothetical protein
VFNDFALALSGECEVAVAELKRLRGSKALVAKRCHAASPPEVVGILDVWPFGSFSETSCPGQECE